MNGLIRTHWGFSPPKFKMHPDRENKFSGESEKDIHERNSEYLLKSYENACFVADKYNWKKVICVKNENIRTIDDINNELYSIVMQIIEE